MKGWQKWAIGAGALAVAQAAIVVLVTSSEEARVPTRGGSPWRPIAAVPLGDLPPLVVQHERPMVLYFWATWCEPCTRQLPEHLALADALAGTIDVWLVARDEGPDAVDTYFRGELPRYVVHDSDGRLGDALGVAVLPTSFFVARGGLITDRTLKNLDAFSLVALSIR